MIAVLRLFLYLFGPPRTPAAAWGRFQGIGSLPAGDVPVPPMDTAAVVQALKVKGFRGEFYTRLYTNS